MITKNVRTLFTSRGCQGTLAAFCSWVLMIHRPINSADRGLLRKLLTRSYQPLKELDESPWIPSDSTWQEYDDYIFDNLGKAEEQVFLTEVNGTAVGFFSFTVRDTEATIGRNCVLPEEGGKGIGTGQVSEVIHRCSALGIKRLYVITGTHRFFVPAQKMYLRAGFSEIDRYDDGRGVGRILIKYSLELRATAQ